MTQEVHRVKVGSHVRVHGLKAQFFEGRVGVVQDIEDEIAMVEFSDGFVTPCWLPNLEEVPAPLTSV